MSTFSQRIDSLDVSVFSAIPSETSIGDKRSLLAIHRATARKHMYFNYLEIGSHLGGSIQPYLLDTRCKKIYSIDSRPFQQPDDRSPGYFATYHNNSSERMLSMLANVGLGNISKIECIDSEASQIDPSRIAETPDVIFIDGEHTKVAALSDFRFSEQVIGKLGTIVFHDSHIIWPAILEVCKQMRKEHRTYTPLILEGSIFAIFFDPEKIHADPYLATLYRKNRHFQALFPLKIRLRKLLVDPAIRALQAARNMLRKIIEKSD